jgi:hypothetical protein
LDNLKAIELALTIVSAAAKKGTVLRLYGGIAVALHSKAYSYLLMRDKERVYDIDLVGSIKQINEIRALFGDMDFIEDPVMMRLFGKEKRKFYNPVLQIYIDVSLDSLIFCHEITLLGRFELSYPTIPLSDLLLSKLQIVNLTRKDLTDLIVILLEHEVDCEAQETIDLQRIIYITSNSWGFWETVKTNLDKIEHFLGEIHLNDNLLQIVLSRTNILRNAIEFSRKSFAWRIRSLIGTRLRWYNEVEIIESDEFSL